MSKNFFQFIYDLNIYEQKIIKQSLAAYSKRNVSENKSLELFNLIVNTYPKMISDKELSVRLYKKSSNNNRLRTAKARLKSKIFETLTQDFVIDGSKELDERSRQSIKLRKKMAQIYCLYFLKGKKIYTIRCIKEVIKLAKIYENYPIYLDGLIFLNSIQLNKVNYSQLIQRNAELDKAQIIYNLINKVCIRYNSICTLSVLQERKLEFKKLLITSIKEFEPYEKKNISKIFNYFFYLICIIYYTLINNLKKAEEYTVKLINVVKTNKSVYCKARLATSHSMYGQVLAKRFKLDEAINNLKISLELFPKGSLNVIIIYELLFLISLQKRDKVLAKKCLDAILKTNINIDEYRKSIHKFYAACYYFTFKNINASLNLLLQNNELNKDKLGRDSLIRIYTILCYIEKEDFIEADRAISSLNLHFCRLKKKSKIIPKRMAKILSILMRIKKYRYCFINYKSELKIQLSSFNKNTAWTPFSNEVICFEEWLKSKL